MIEKLGADHRLSIEERELLIHELKPELSGDYVYLQTCNRVELYRGDGTAERQLVKHLFRVVSGLESKMIGEAHIQGQVKRAYMEARENDHISSGLHRLFQVALRCGKRVRSETAISTGAVSHAHATVLAVRNWVEDICRTPLLIVGVNELTQRIITFLSHFGEPKITVANRTLGNISQLKVKRPLKTMTLEQLPERVNDFPVIISATASMEYLIRSSWLEPLKERLLIDLAVPRDIEPSASELPLTTLHTVEHLEALVDHSIERRTAEIADAEKIIEEEIAEYFKAIEKGARYAQARK